MASLKEIQERKNGKAAEIKVLGDKIAEWTPENRQQWTALNAEYDAIKAELDTELESQRNAEAVQARLAAIEAENRNARNDGRVGVDAAERRADNPENAMASRVDARALALHAWLRSGSELGITREHRSACASLGINPNAREIAITSDVSYGERAWSAYNGRQMTREIRAGLDVTNSGKGITTIPEGFVYELERQLLAYSSVRNVARIVGTATGYPLPWPTVNDTSNTGELLAEATSFGTSVDPTFAAVTFGAFKLSSKPVFVSQELIEDSAFNLSSEIASMLGERLGRIEATYTTTGAGSGDPKGVVTCAGTGVTSGSATVITADEIINLIHSLDPAYRSMGSVGFMMHDTALSYVRKLKDSLGAYLWVPGMQAGVADRLLGYQVSINQSMEPLVNNLPVTAKKHILFGAYEKFIIRDVAQMRFYRLDERYRDTDQTAFIAFKRMDCDTIQAAALKVLLQA